jgi:hypothetical protein
VDLLPFTVTVLVSMFTDVLPTMTTDGMPLRTTHDGVNARHQFVLVERLGHVVVGAERETLHLVFDAGEAGANQDRRVDLGFAQRLMTA